MSLADRPLTPSRQQVRKLLKLLNFLPSRKVGIPSSAAAAINLAEMPENAGNSLLKMLATHVKGPHLIQGIGSDIIANVMDIEIMDKIVQVTMRKLFKQLRCLPSKNVGISSRAAAAAAIKLAKRLENAGKLIVVSSVSVFNLVIFPSFGDRYLSSTPFDSIRHEVENMTFD
ncbi:cysteine synthase-like [Hevea brasiliensis]|uniref:cysteine synthase-like n=1 Tax=Hevea brasiliensis TaxID=3981 RepID=UPI0025F45ED3|nr:cysteine synthase-like [Hevea brasiliensis]